MSTGNRNQLQPSQPTTRLKSHLTPHNTLLIPIKHTLIKQTTSQIINDRSVCLFSWRAKPFVFIDTVRIVFLLTSCHVLYRFNAVTWPWKLHIKNDIEWAWMSWSVVPRYPLLSSKKLYYIYSRLDLFNLISVSYWKMGYWVQDNHGTEFTWLVTMNPTGTPETINH